MMNHKVPDFSDQEIVSKIPKDFFLEKEYTNIKIRRSRIKTIIEDCIFNKGDLLGADFTDSTFRNCSFVDTDFRGSYLVDCNIDSCTFTRCRLQDVDAQGAIVKSTTFVDCRLQNFELQYGILEGVAFSSSYIIDCDFLGVSFQDCEIKKCHIKNCITRYAKGVEAECFKE